MKIQITPEVRPIGVEVFDVLEKHHADPGQCLSVLIFCMIIVARDSRCGKMELLKVIDDLWEFVGDAEKKRIQNN